MMVKGIDACGYVRWGVKILKCWRGATEKCLRWSDGQDCDSKSSNSVGRVSARFNSATSRLQTAHSQYTPPVRHHEWRRGYSSERRMNTGRNAMENGRRWGRKREWSGMGYVIARTTWNLWIFSTPRNSRTFVRWPSRRRAQVIKV